MHGSSYDATVASYAVLILLGPFKTNQDWTTWTALSGNLSCTSGSSTYLNL